MSISAFDDGSRSISGLARIFGRDRRTISKAIQDAGIQPAGRSAGHDTYPIGEIAQALYAPTDADGKELTPREKRDYWHSENERLKFEKETRKLLDAAEVAEVTATAFQAIAQEMRALPDRLERRKGISGELAQSIADEIDAAMDGLATRLQELMKKNDEEENAQ